MKIHKIKLMSQFFDEVDEREKDFEVRFDDRGYCEGDLLILREWDGVNYTGNVCVRKCTRLYKLDDVGLKGWVAMKIQ